MLSSGDLQPVTLENEIQMFSSWKPCPRLGWENSAAAKDTSDGSGGEVFEDKLRRIISEPLHPSSSHPGLEHALWLWASLFPSVLSFIKKRKVVQYSFEYFNVC